MENRKARKLRRAVIFTLGAVYLLVVIGATIYSQTGYLDSLPLVKIGSPDQGKVPASAAAMGQDGPIPVSYTHLDVYKRQNQHRGEAGAGRLGSFRHAFQHEG